MLIESQKLPDEGALVNSAYFNDFSDETEEVPDSQTKIVEGLLSYGSGHGK